MTPKLTSSLCGHDEALISDFASILQYPEGKVLSLLEETSDLKSLRFVCHVLFSEVEKYHTLLHRFVLKRSTRSETGIHKDACMASLAGIDALYLGSDDSCANEVNAEMLWGQIELQNTALGSLLRNELKKLSVSDPNSIKILALERLTGNDVNCHDDREDRREEDKERHETKLMHARMARPFEEMDDIVDQGKNDDFGLVEGKVPSKDTKSQGLDEAAVDPIREKMMDGFFDLHEMEAFADEEEEYLPDEAFGRTEDESGLVREQSMTFHQKHRAGNFDAVSGDEREGDGSVGSDTDELAVHKNLVRRRKYRPQDEVDALEQIYEESHQDVDNRAIDITAEEFFGKPNLLALEQNKQVKMKDLEDGENDSEMWDHHNVEGVLDWRADQLNTRDVSEQRHTSRKELELSPTKAKKAKKAIISKEVNTRENFSEFQRVDVLLQQTKELEKEIMSEKPWHMIGEAKGNARPLNSLIISTPEFETAAKPTPGIGQDHSKNIEEIVKKRVLVEDWDNVLPRELPDVGWNVKRGEAPEVSQEKSKLGLGEIYEREFLKKAVGYDKTADEKATEESKVKDEMKALFASLCSKLDALSNYHFAPRPIADEADIRVLSTPAIAMEEVLPLHVSGARGVAPEEIYATKCGRESVLRGDSETSQNERRRLRNSRKTARRKSRQQKLADEKLISRLQPSGVGLSNPYEKRKILEDLQSAHARGKVTMGQADSASDYGKSTQFFARLQTEKEGGKEDSSKRKRVDGVLASGRSSSLRL